MQRACHLAVTSVHTKNDNPTLRFLAPAAGTMVVIAAENRSDLSRWTQHAAPGRLVIAATAAAATVGQLTGT